MKKRATINISLEAKSMLDSIRSSGQSYDGTIRELVKFWREKRGILDARRAKNQKVIGG
jgi:predicted CopG family antitoxin